MTIYTCSDGHKEDGGTGDCKICGKPMVPASLWERAKKILGQPTEEERRAALAEDQSRMGGKR